MKQGDLLQIVKESMSLDEARNPENEPINKIIRKAGDFEALSKKEERFLAANGIDIVDKAPDGWTVLRGSNGSVLDSYEIDSKILESNGDFDFYNFLTNEINYDYYDYNDPTKMSNSEYDALQPYRHEKNAIMSADYEIKDATDRLNRAKKDRDSALAKARAKHGKKNESLHRSRHRRMNEGWRGCDNIEMEYYNDYADPSLVYDGYRFNYYDIEDALWNDFLEDTGYTDDMSEDPKVEQEFNSYVQNYAEDYLEDVIYGGYFEDGSTDWRDRYNESFKRSHSRRMNESASGTWSDALWDAVNEELVDAKDLCFSFIKYLSEDEVEDFCRYNDLTDLVEEDDYDDIDESCSKKSTKKSRRKFKESIEDYDEFYIEVDPSSATPFKDMLFTAMDEGMAETVGREAVSSISEDDAEYICKILGFVE